MGGGPCVCVTGSCRMRGIFQPQDMVEMVVRLLHIVHYSHNARAFAGALLQHLQKLGRGGGVHGVEGFVQQQHARVLHQHARKQHALKLPAGKRSDGLPCQREHAHLLQRGMHARPLFAAQAAPPAQFVPQAQGHQVLHQHGQVAIDACLLRQVGNVLSPQLLPVHAAAFATHQPHGGLEQSAFACSVGAHDGPALPGGKTGGLLANGLCALVAHGDGIEHDGAGRCWQRSERRVGLL